MSGGILLANSLSQFSIFGMNIDDSCDGSKSVTLLLRSCSRCLANLGGSFDSLLYRGFSVAVCTPLGFATTCGMKFSTSVSYQIQ